VIADPVVEGETQNPCAKLKELTDTPLVRTRLNTMKVNGGNAEKGLRVDKQPNDGAYKPSQILDSNNGTAHINIRVNPFTEAIAHTHPPSGDGYFTMFAGPDIIKMGEMVKMVQSTFSPVVNPIDIAHILIADGMTFAIRFDDAASVQTLRDIYEDKDKKEDFKDDLEDAFKSDKSGPPLYQSTTTVAKQQRHIYKLLGKYNLNMSLYQANYDANGFISDWQKINKETLEKEPCN